MEIAFEALIGLRLFSDRPVEALQHGEHRGRRLGGRFEFRDYRFYTPGDDLRRVDWNVYARTDRVVVKQFYLDAQLPVLLLWDVSRSMAVGEPSPFERGRQLCEAVGFLALHHGERVTAYALRGGSVEGFSAQSLEQFPLLRRWLEERSPATATALGSDLRLIAARERQRGIAVLLSDLFDLEGAEGGLRALLATGYAPAVVHLLPPEVLEPDPPESVELEDAETGRSRPIRWDADARLAYRQQLEVFLNRARRFCRRRGIRYALVRTDSPLRSVLLSELRAAGILIESPR
ncbi:MAG: hypothetical protein KatS3mg115_2170 [Candidatus Poribacteria bacterium]|nr:MAG: hypothetical protein KatS3mg115_2170 [Candidatus Poribacteria bacterium]